MATAVLSFVLCLARVVLRFYDAASTAVDILYDVLLAILWYYNVASQSSADLTDSKHLSTRPWYLEKSCDVVSGRAEVACNAAKATFYLAVCSTYVIKLIGFFCFLFLFFRIAHINPSQISNYTSSLRILKSSYLSDFPGNRILYLAKLFLACMRIAYRCGEQGLLLHEPHRTAELFFRLRVNRHECFANGLEDWDDSESTVLSVGEV